MLKKEIQRKLQIFFGLIVLGLSIFAIYGCGGGSNTATQGYTIKALNSTLGAPSVGLSPSCYQPVSFLITDASGKAASGITVQIHTGPINTQVAPFSLNSGFCPDAVLSPFSDITMKSDDNGVVAIEFLVDATTTGTEFFIDVSSGAATPAELKTAASVT